MIIRVITYHSLPGKDVKRWMKGIASELRSVRGARHVDFVQSDTDPLQYGAIMHFRSKEDLEYYKETETGTYRNLVRSLRETWLDESKPINEQIFEIIDV